MPHLFAVFNPTTSTNSIVAQWLECSTVSREVAGSNPVGTAKLRIEQLAVYSPWTREDVGSNPASQTKESKQVYLNLICNETLQEHFVSPASQTK